MDELWKVRRLLSDGITILTVYDPTKIRARHARPCPTRTLPIQSTILLHAPDPISSDGEWLDWPQALLSAVVNGSERNANFGRKSCDLGVRFAQRTGNTLALGRCVRPRFSPTLGLDLESQARRYIGELHAFLPWEIKKRHKLRDYVRSWSRDHRIT